MKTASVYLTASILIASCAGCLFLPRIGSSFLLPTFLVITALKKYSRFPTRREVLFILSFATLFFTGCLPLVHNDQRAFCIAFVVFSMFFFLQILLIYKKAWKQEPASKGHTCES